MKYLMLHLYLSYQPSQAALSSEKALLEGWCGKQGIDDYQILEEKLTSGRVSQFQINKLLSGVQAGDTVVACSLSRLGRGINMLIAVMRTLHERGAVVHVIDEKKDYLPNESTKTFLDTLEFAARMTSTIKAERSNESIALIKSSGEPLGRPKGSRKAPEKNVLHGKYDTLLSLRSQGMNITQIASAIGVSRGTVFNFLAAQKNK